MGGALGCVTQHLEFAEAGLRSCRVLVQGLHGRHAGVCKPEESAICRCTRLRFYRHRRRARPAARPASVTRVSIPTRFPRRCRGRRGHGGRLQHQEKRCGRRRPSQRSINLTMVSARGSCARARIPCSRATISARSRRSAGGLQAFRHLARAARSRPRGRNGATAGGRACRPCRVVQQAGQRTAGGARRGGGVVEHPSARARRCRSRGGTSPAAGSRTGRSSSAAGVQCAANFCHRGSCARARLHEPARVPANARRPGGRPRRPRPSRASVQGLGCQLEVGEACGEARHARRMRTDPRRRQGDTWRKTRAAGRAGHRGSIRRPSSARTDRVDGEVAAGVASSVRRDLRRGVADKPV